MSYRIWGGWGFSTLASQTPAGYSEGPSSCSSRSENSRANVLPSRVAESEGGHGCLKSLGLFPCARRPGQHGHQEPLRPP